MCAGLHVYFSQINGDNSASFRVTIQIENKFSINRCSTEPRARTF